MPTAPKKKKSSHAPSSKPVARKFAADATTTRSLVVAPTETTTLSQSYADLVVKPAKYEPSAGKLAFDAMAASRGALDNVHVARIDVQSAALVALGVHAFATQATRVHDAFAALDAAGLFVMATVDALETAAFAALYAVAQAEAAGAFKSGAVVPADVASKAAEVEKRMQRRCEYLFSGDPEIAPLLDLLRPGSGYSDLANDLIGYADIYARRAAIVPADGDPSYRPTDLADANALAGELLSYVTAAMTPKAQVAHDALQRSFTLLMTIYSEVQSAGLWLTRFDSKRFERFPSLTTAARAHRKPSKKGAAAPAGTAPATKASGG